MVEATIEDLAITKRSSRESEGKKAENGEDVSSTTFLKDWRFVQTWEQRQKWERLGVDGRSSAAAEKNDERKEMLPQCRSACVAKIPNCSFNPD